LQNRKKLRLLLIPLASLMLLFMTFSTFAYWYNVDQTSRGAVLVGEETTLTVTVGEQTDGYLVPAGYAIHSDEVEEVIISFSAELSRKESISRPLDFAVEVRNATLGGTTDYAYLVNFAIDAPTTIQNEAVIVNVSVTLSEPETQEIAEAIYSQEISFQIVITASV